MRPGEVHMNEAAAQPPTADPATRPDSLLGWTHVIYGLHAFSLLTGILGAATASWCAAAVWRVGNGRLLQRAVHLAEQTEQ